MAGVPELPPALLPNHQGFQCSRLSNPAPPCGRALLLPPGAAPALLLCAASVSGQKRIGQRVCLIGTDVRDTSKGFPVARPGRNDYPVPWPEIHFVAAVRISAISRREKYPAIPVSPGVRLTLDLLRCRWLGSKSRTCQLVFRIERVGLPTGLLPSLTALLLIRMRKSRQINFCRSMLKLPLTIHRTGLSFRSALFSQHYPTRPGNQRLRLARLSRRRSCTTEATSEIKYVIPAATSTLRPPSISSPVSRFSRSTSASARRELRRSDRWPGGLSQTS